MKSKKIYIQGMHCASCEKLLDGEFKNIPGVKSVKVDRKTDSAEIFFEDEEPDFEEIKNIAEKFGYSVSENKPGADMIKKNSKASWQDWLNAVVIVLVILFLYRFFQNAGFVMRLNINNTSISYGVAFLVGSGRFGFFVSRGRGGSRHRFFGKISERKIA